MALLQIVSPVLLLLLLGFIAQRKGLMTEAQIEGLKKLVCDYTLPAVLLGAFYRASFDRTIVVCAITVFLCCCAALGLGTLCKRAFAPQQALLPFLTTGFEMGMLGYAFYEMRFGADKLTNMAVADLGQVLFVFTLYRLLLGLRGGSSARASLKGVLTSPILLAVAAGLLLGVSGLGARIAASPIGGTVDACITFLAGPTSCVILFVVGYGLRFSAASLKAALVAAFARLLIMAGLFFAALWVIGLFVPVPKDLFWALALMFSLPGPFVLPLFVRDAQEGDYVSTCLSVYTLVSMALFAGISLLA